MVPYNAPEKTYQLAYNYRFDALRFSFKIFALLKVLRAGLVANEFAWIDADYVCDAAQTRVEPEHEALVEEILRTNLGGYSHVA